MLIAAPPERLPGGDRTGTHPARRLTVDRAAAVLLVVLGFLGGARPISDNSFLTHLATGRIILETGAVPSADPYSYTAAGEPWVVQSWLASSLYAVLERGLGAGAIVVLNGALTALVVAAVWVLCGRAGRLPTTVALTGAVVLAGFTEWSPRPLLFGLVGLAACLLALDGRLRPGAVAPIVWVWAATHGSFPVGLAVIAAFAAGRWLDDRSAPRHELAVLGFASIGAVASIAGPLGHRALLFPVTLLQRRDALAFIREWNPPRWDSVGQWVFLGLVSCALVTFARRSAPWRAILPTVLAVLMAVMAARNVFIASLIIVSVLARTAGARSGPEGDEPFRAPVLAAVTGVLSVGLVLGSLPSVLAAPIDLAWYPTEQVDHLDERGLLRDPEVRLVSREAVGNYLQHRFGTDVATFSDDRIDMYPDHVVDDMVTLVRGGSYAAVLDRWSADVVLWPADEPLAYWLEGQAAWTLIERGEDWSLFCRSADIAARCLAAGPR